MHPDVHVIEPGRSDEAEAAVRLLMETDAGLFAFYGGGSLDLWAEIAALEWRAERGIYCHDMSHVVRLDGELAALLLCYTPERDRRIDWSLGSSRGTIDAARMRHLDEARRLTACLFPAVPPDAYYVQNIAVRPEARGRGLGVALMRRAFELASEAGCRSCHLDVDATTPAVGFYVGLGFRVAARTEAPGLPAAAHLRMVLPIPFLA